MSSIAIGVLKIIGAIAPIFVALLAVFTPRDKDGRYTSKAKIGLAIAILIGAAGAIESVLETAAEISSEQRADDRYKSIVKDLNDAQANAQEAKEITTRTLTKAEATDSQLNEFQYRSARAINKGRVVQEQIRSLGKKAVSGEEEIASTEFATARAISANHNQDVKNAQKSLRVAYASLVKDEQAADAAEKSSLASTKAEFPIPTRGNRAMVVLRISLNPPPPILKTYAADLKKAVSNYEVSWRQNGNWSADFVPNTDAHYHLAFVQINPGSVFDPQGANNPTLRLMIMTYDSMEYCFYAPPIKQLQLADLDGRRDSDLCYQSEAAVSKYTYYDIDENSLYIYCNSLSLMLQHQNGSKLGSVLDLPGSTFSIFPSLPYVSGGKNAQPVLAPSVSSLVRDGSVSVSAVRLNSLDMFISLVTPRITTTAA